MPLSAGLQLDGLPQADFLNPYIVPLAAVILLGVFSIQSRGSSSVGRLFGPVMAAWFTVLALDPRYAFAYLAHAGAWPAFAVLGSSCPIARFLPTR